MKVSVRSNQESLVIYVGRVEASRHVITVTVILVGIGFLFFTVGVFFLIELLEDKGIMKDVIFYNMIFSFFYSVFFWLRGIPMAIGLPQLLAQFKKDDGAIILAAKKEGLSITPSPYTAFSIFFIKAINYTWNNVEKISLIRQLVVPDHRKETFNQITIFLRDNPAEKNKCWLKRKIWGKNIQTVNLDGFSEEQRAFVRDELIRLSCQKVKIL